MESFECISIEVRRERHPPPQKLNTSPAEREATEVHKSHPLLMREKIAYDTAGKEQLHVCPVFFLFFPWPCPKSVRSQLSTFGRLLWERGRPSLLRRLSALPASAVGIQLGLAYVSKPIE